MPFSQEEKGISNLPSPLGRGAGVRDGKAGDEGMGPLLHPSMSYFFDSMRRS